MKQQTELPKEANKEDTVYAGGSTTVYNLFSHSNSIYELGNQHISISSYDAQTGSFAHSQNEKNQTKAYNTGLEVPLY